MEYSAVRDLILSADDTKLSEQQLQQMLKCMSNKEEMQQLASYKDKMTDLSDPERFGVVVSVFLSGAMFSI